MRIASLIVALAVVPAVLGAAGCGGSVTGDASSPVVAPAQREPAARIHVPRLGGAGTLAVGVPDARPTVVNMWASWCGPCRKEMPDLQRFAAAHPGVRLIGVAVNDDEGDARAFAKEVGVRFPLGFDADNAVADAYGVSGLPTTVVLDRRGRVAVTWPGPITDADITRITADLDAGG